MKKITIVWCILLTSYVCNAQNWQWAKQMGSNYLFYDDFIRSLITDDTNIYVIGSYGGTFYLPGDTLVSSGNDDSYFAKYDNDGNLLWAKTFGSSYNGVSAHERSNGVYDPVNKCIYITGTYVISGHEEIFVAKMDLNGNFLWTKFIGSTGDDYAYIFVKPDGNILLEGHLASSSMIDTIPIAANGFFASYDSAGNLLWAKHKMDGPDKYQVSVAFIDNDFVIAGTAGPTSPATVDTAVINVNGTYDGFLARFDSVANLKWIKVFGGKGNGGLNWITTDANKNIYGAGSIQDSVFYVTDTLFNPVYDYLIAKFDENGNMLWNKIGSSTVGADASSILTDTNGNSYVIGSFLGNSDFGSYNITANTTQDMYIARVDENGSCLGVRNFGVASGTKVTVNNTGAVFVGGTFNNTVNIGGTVMTSYGNRDIFIAKHDAITGIGEGNGRMANNQLFIYANPNSGKCNITVPDDFLNEKNLTLSIYDNTGRLIQQQTLEMNDGKIKINLEQEAKGIYNVTLSSKKKSYNGKIVFE
ncbi:MAG: T9SS type A sorting domain-containing protein [Bacteroidetes bacterium]|jgi:hypothetical protein|nr:T9SS type A sorting domain-containing protein [Bacteroidota bacterium]